MTVHGTISQKKGQNHEIWAFQKLFSSLPNYFLNNKKILEKCPGKS